MKIDFLERVKKIKAYKPGKPEEQLKREIGVEDIIKMASNENPLGVSPKAKKAIIEELDKLYFYPDDTYFELKKKIAEKYGLEKENVLLGAGSVEIIKMIASSIIEPGRYAIISKNSFLMYKIVIQEFAGEEYIYWVDTKNYAYDLEGFKKYLDEMGNIHLIFIANPNNPTGTYIPERELYDFLIYVPEDILVVLDEAYEEYVEAEDYSSGVKWLNEFENLIVLKTLSKAYGLAGLRVGYALSNKEIIEQLSKVRIPFNVSRISAKAALFALDDKDFIKKSFETNRKGKRYLEKELPKLGFKLIPSQTNFIMVIPEKKDPQFIVKELEKRGIIVRPLTPFGIPEGIRITIGTEEMNKRLVKALKEIMEA